MQPKTVTIPLEQQQNRICASCSSALRYTIIPNVMPHLYCAHCHNAYYEPSAAATIRSLFWQNRAMREQHDIQSHAPVCECGGLFLFNAHPHCTHCGRALPLPFPEDAKGRLRYHQLVTFDDAKLYHENGTVTLYHFAV